MKRIAFCIVFVLLISGWLLTQAPGSFDDFFIDKTMRIDYFHIGDAKEEIITLDKIYQQGIWAGSTRHLIDDLDNGRYYLKIYDANSGELIYSKGFDSYFGEYKTTDLALKGEKKTYHETALIPYPKNKIVFALEARDRENILSPLFSQQIDPSSISIIKEKLDGGIRVFEILKNGDPHEKVDVAFIAEGYKGEEEEKLQSDFKRFEAVLFNQEPFKTHKTKFNIYGVFKPSEDSGCDEPRHGIFKNTALSSSFNSLGSARYLLTEDNKALRDIAGAVPYDVLVIMINHKRYGGGGIYNLYCTCTVDSQWSEYLLLHELGHSFAGLADEYYTSAVAYTEFYPRGIEPAEPNITALLDSQNLKWNDLISPGIEIPTPWEKEAFDRMDNEYQKIRQEIDEKIARMKREGAPESEIKRMEQESETLSRKHAKKVDEYLLKSKFKDRVGAFEGAGYSAKGLYRPMLDCIMFTKGKKPYCKVCERAIFRIIERLTE